MCHFNVLEQRVHSSNPFLCPSVIPASQWSKKHLRERINISSVSSTFCAHTMGFPGGPVCKESTCNVGDLGLITGLGRSLEKSMHRGAWQASVHGVTKSQTWLRGCHSVHTTMSSLVIISIHSQEFGSLDHPFSFFTGALLTLKWHK